MAVVLDAREGEVREVPPVVDDPLGVGIRESDPPERRVLEGRLSIGDPAELERHGAMLPVADLDLDSPPVANEPTALVLRLLLGGVVLAVALLVAAGPAAPVPSAVRPPTSAVCKPASVRMEYFSSLGAKLGEYDARLQGLVKIDAYNAK